MRARIVNFERGKDPKEALDIGVIWQNKDPYTRKKNFESSFPEVKFSSMGEEKMIAPGEHPVWQTLLFTIHEPDDSETLEQREQKYRKWFEDYTDFDIIDTESFDRTWHPMGDINISSKYEQSFTIWVRNKEDIA